MREKLIREQPTFQELPNHERNIIKRVEERAGQKEWKMCQVALVWLVQKGAVPIVGISSVDEACEIRGKSLAAEDMKWLEELYQPKKCYRAWVKLDKVKHRQVTW